MNLSNEPTCFGTLHAGDRSLERSQKVLLMLACAFPPENLSGSRRPFRFAKYLPKYGYSTEVISASPGELQGWDNVHRVPGDGAVRTSVRLWGQTLDFLQTHVLPYHDMLPWIPHAVAAAGQVCRRSPVAAVFSTFPPLASHLAASVIKRLYGVKWIADFRDPLVGSFSRMRSWGWLYDCPLERHIVNTADAVIVNTAPMKTLLCKRYPRRADRIFTIYNGYDPDDAIQAVPSSRPDYRVMAHVGSIYGGRHPGVVLESLERLITSGLLDSARFRLRLIGSTDLTEQWLSEAPFRNLSERRCLEMTAQPIAEPKARRAMSEADFLLLLNIDKVNSGVQVPAKLFDYIRTGRPILCLTTRGSATEEILEGSGVRYQCLYVTDSGPDVDRKVLEFLKLPSDPTPANDWFAVTFSAPSQAKALSAILDNVLSDGAIG